MKKLLFISDLFKNADHNAIERIFNGYLKEFYEIDLIFFTKDDKEISYKKNKIFIPYSLKKEIQKHLTKHYDIIIVRNRFDILKQFAKKDRDYKLGFQLSFPHTFRRYYEAQITKKSLFRKKIEYEIKNLYEKSFIKKCDFFLPISNAMKNLFYYDIQIDYFPLPLGIDPINDTQKEKNLSQKINFIYIGAIDKLRRFDTVLKAFLDIDQNLYKFDIFTPHHTYASNLIQTIMPKNRSINLHSSLPRKELAKKIPLYDVGISLIPQTLLYSVASPTKVMEYYEAKIPSLMSKIPECMEIFCHNKEGWLCDFDEKEIKKTIKNIITIPKERIKEMGERGFERLLEKRNYKTLSKDLHLFLSAI